MMAAVAETPPPPRELDDLTLARARRGEAEAQRALVVMYQQRVWALLSRHRGAGDPELVKDLAQETFLRVFKALSSFQPSGEARLSTWILTIGVRLAIDHGRREQRKPTFDPGMRSVRTPHQETERRALGEAIQKAVHALPDDYRSAFILRGYHGFEYREIANALNCDLGTVKSRISRAKRLLREQLKEIRHDG